MNAFAQECSSGCESGWTLYFEQSFLLNNNTNTNTKNPRNRIDNNSNNVTENYVRDEEEEEMMMREDEEEDLSMVSDASSGPPHIHYEEESYYSMNCCNYDNDGSFKDTTLVSNGEIRRQNERPHRRGRRQGDKDPEIAVPSHFLDDTASSPAINWSKNQTPLRSTLDYSQAGAGYSATHFQGRSAYQDQFGYVQPPFSGNHFQNNQWF